MQLMFVLAGGFGTRLKEVVTDVPKPMADCAGKPLLELQLRHWYQQGQRRFCFLLHHMPEKIIPLLSSASQWLASDVDVSWVVEPEPLGTGGSIAHALKYQNNADNFLVVNADTWLSGGIKKMSEGSSPAVGVVRVPNTARFGLLKLDDDGFISSFSEKENSNGGEGGIINAGIYKLSSEFIESASSRVFSLEQHLTKSIKMGVSVLSVKLDGSFYDIGVPRDYYEFSDWIKENA
jgi:D-glycero-alpha-D-manno-heptose 1-phosphate guanylyltransferase